MSRLIDADALRKEHCKGCSADIQESCKDDPVCASLMWLNEAPTIDAVPVVRCKDCVYNENGSCTKSEDCDLDYRPDYFCADGERRSDD